MIYPSNALKYKRQILDILACLLVLFGVPSCASNGFNGSGTSSTEQPSTAQVSRKYVDSIKKFSQNKQIEKALDFIRTYDDQTVATQVALTEIPAPSFEEHKFGKGKRFASLLKQYGADSVWTDTEGNVIGLRKGIRGDRVLGLAAHLDTVFPEGTDLSVARKGDKLVAPGIGDDNRGLTTILTVLKALEVNNIQTKSDILFIGDVGEEGLGDLRGMKQLFSDNGSQIDAFISIDGTGGLGTITNGALGSHRYRVTFKGPGGHSWGAFGLANPAHALGQAIANFVKAADDYTSRNGPRTSYNVGRIGGGTSVNSIPFSAWMEVDMRSLSPERLDRIDTLFHQAIRSGLKAQNSIRRSGPPLTVDIKMIGDRPSGHTPPNDPLVQRAMAASIYFGKKPRLRTSSTDSNIPISKGIPAITLGGGGDGGGAHSLHEWYANKEGYKGIQRVFLIVAAQARAVLKHPNGNSPHF